MSEQPSLPPDFEFLKRVRPFTADEIRSLAPLCARYEDWKRHHNITRHFGPPGSAEAARDLETIYRAFREWGLNQHPPFIREVMTEQRRQEIVAELCRIAGIPLEPQANEEQGRGLAAEGASAEIAQTPPATPRQTEAEDQAIPFASPLCAPDLARLLRERGFGKATDDAVDAFLRQSRKQHDDCYISVDDDDRRRNTPKYLYRPEVWPWLVQHFSRRPKV